MTSIIADRLREIADAINDDRMDAADVGYLFGVGVAFLQKTGVDPREALTLMLSHEPAEEMN